MTEVSDTLAEVSARQARLEARVSDLIELVEGQVWPDDHDDVDHTAGVWGDLDEPIREGGWA